MTAKNNNKSKSNKNTSGGFNTNVFMVEPDPSQAAFIEVAPDGTFNLFPEIGFVKSGDKREYKVVRVINGNVLPNYVILNLTTSGSGWFKGIRPDVNGEIKIELYLLADLKFVNDEKNTKGLVLTVSRDRLDQVAFIALGSSQKSGNQKSIVVKKMYSSGCQNYLEIEVFDDSGNSVAGTVVVSANQKFQIGNKHYDQSGEVKIPTNGYKAVVTPESSENFRFTDKRTDDCDIKLLLGGK